MTSRWRQGGVYAITADLTDTALLLDRAGQVLDAGVCLLQYRNKQATAELRAQQAKELLALCRASSVPLIINDDWRLAAELGADGVHLGGEDGDVALARQALGAQAIIGASCYDELSRARAAVTSGASYVAFGAFFASRTKPLARTCGLDVLQAAADLGVPRVAIGGITPDNAGPLVEAGADMLAVISGIVDADDPAAAVRAYARHFTRPGASTAPNNASE
ncbi:thiamine phosphate synthase [Lysobacter korlensis]|uniref:Thiamine-phosphate synthase n=1 Tax=Lysobacter korlensis TaxID=553636 RepID=A0ABV6RSM1_9GAMM